MGLSPVVKLSSGYDMPLVGMGLWKVEKNECADTIYNAIKVGYRLFDGALDYGNEKECGDGIARALKDGLVKREELFIVTKIWVTFYDPEHVESCIRRQLKDWQLDYFDLYLMHFPGAYKYVDPAVRYPPGWAVDGKDEVVRSPTTTQQTWQVMEALVDKKLTHSIGISNFQAQLIYDLLRYARIPPATLQVEHHPLYVQPNLMRLAKAEGIQVTAYSSFGPMSFLDFNFESAKKMTPLIEDPVIMEIAAKHKRRPAEVLLRWSTQQGIAVIPKVTFVDLMEQNLNHWTFDLTQEEIDKINAKDLKFKFNTPNAYFDTEKLHLFA